jgi:hypothetical protein
MLLNSELRIPTAALVLSAFAARLLWRLAVDEASARTAGDPAPATPAIDVAADIGAGPSLARARSVHGLRLANPPLPSSWSRT